ncbi:MAG: pyridoxamine 5'-phosphate oxidase family protein [Rectinemataceae bacterium]|jgi:general stress protein 26
MEYFQILDRALALIGGGSPAIFTTLGEGGYPRSRWMVPCALPRLRGMVYALTARDFAKVAEIEADPRVAWVFQSADFSEVTELRGRARTIDDPSFSAEVIKAIGPNLTTFWRLNMDPSAIRVIETEVEAASILFPARAERYSAIAPLSKEATRG